jgi:hypothetical protein
MTKRKVRGLFHTLFGWKLSSFKNRNEKDGKRKEKAGKKKNSSERRERRRN